MQRDWKLPRLDRNIVADISKTIKPSVVKVSATFDFRPKTNVQRGVGWITLAGPVNLTPDGEPSGAPSAPLTSPLQQIFVAWEFDKTKPNQGDLRIGQAPGTGPIRDITVK
jgi:hypothetical protein